MHVTEKTHGTPPGGLPGQLVTKTGTQDHQAAWADPMVTPESVTQAAKEAAEAQRFDFAAFVDSAISI